MLQNAYLLAKIGADTAENEQHFVEMLRRRGPRGSARPPTRATYPEGGEGGSAGEARGHGSALPTC